MSLRPHHDHPAAGRVGRPRASGLVVAVLVVTLGSSIGPLVSAQSSPGPAGAPSPTPASTTAATAAPHVPSTPAATAASDPARWEYRTIFVTWDRSILDWVADFSDGTRIQGLDAILNDEGRNGWELVAVVPELWTQIVDEAIRGEARRLRIFLKKPLG